MGVDWDWDKFVQLVDTINSYIHIDLPPFERKSSYIYHDKEHWVVRSKGGSKKRKWYGTYYSLEEAKKVARIYNGNITHIKEAYRVQRRIDGKNVYFGRYPTYDDALKRVEELESNDWEK